MMVRPAEEMRWLDASSARLELGLDPNHQQHNNNNNNTGRWVAPALGFFLFARRFPHAGARAGSGRPFGLYVCLQGLPSRRARSSLTLTFSTFFFFFVFFKMAQRPLIMSLPCKSRRRRQTKTIPTCLSINVLRTAAPLRPDLYL